MKNYQLTNKVVKLIISEISGEITESEKQDLEEWKNGNSKNLQLYQKIKNSENFRYWKTQREKFQPEEAWNQINLQIQPDRNKKFIFTTLKYAAAILLPIIIAGSVYFYVKNRNNLNLTESQQVSSIQPGSAKAILKLGNGDIIFLDSINTDVVVEKDGTIIEKNQSRLNYKTAEGSKTKTNNEIYNSLQVPRGGEFKLKLADGTTVYLNSMSQIKYPVQFTEEIRSVELSGEAYFEVAHDNKRPFIVNTNGMSIKVLGTSFNINAYENTGKIVTTLVEGKLEVKALNFPQISKILTPADQAVYSPESGDLEINQVETDFYTAWTKGKIIFYNNTLEEIMETLTRWYTADVFYLNPSVKELRFSGNMNKYDDIKQILDIIKATNKVNVEVKNTTILFMEK